MILTMHASKLAMCWSGLIWIFKGWSFYWYFVGLNLPIDAILRRYSIIWNLFHAISCSVFPYNCLSWWEWENTVYTQVLIDWAKNTHWGVHTKYWHDMEEGQYCCFGLMLPVAFKFELYYQSIHPSNTLVQSKILFG